MEIIGHYHNANIELEDGDIVIVEYVGKIPSYGAKTLKRLCGWQRDTIFKGFVVGDKVIFEDEKKTYKFRHCVYNIELYLINGKLRLEKLIKGGTQLKLFEK